MSAADDVAALKARLKDFEKTETQLKEKLKEEHAQLVNFQKKLTQAGSHLKSLAQENANLTKSFAQQKADLEAVQAKESSKIAVLEEEIAKTKLGHQKEIKQLVDILETTIDSTDEGQTKQIPDVSTSTLLDSYMQSVQKKLNKSAAVAEKSGVQKDLTQKIKELQKEIQELKNVDHVELIQTCLKSILQDPENGTIDSSVPPSILLTLEQVRSTLQEQQETIQDATKLDKSSIIEEAQKDLKRQITQLNITINELTDERDEAISEKESRHEQIASLETKISSLESTLSTTESEKQASQEREQQLKQEHQSLLGKLSHIKSTLTPRLEQDKQLRQRVGELTQELEVCTRELQQCRTDMMMRDEETSAQMEKQDRALAQLSSKLEEVQREREEYEQMAMQLDAECQKVQEQYQASRIELEQVKQKMASDQMENESERASLSNLQSVLEEFQATKDAEMQAALEHIERQLDVAKKSWAEYEERAHVAEAALTKYQKDVGKTQKYEQEIKEKNLLIGKLRHEAIILNEHLVEAMRKLKEETSESNVDRQLITNLLVGFFMAPRGDRKRFDILTIISSVLQLTEEEKEQIGLSRPKHSSVGSPTIEQPQKESFTDAWISFLLKESSPLRRNRSAVTLSTKHADDSIEL